MILCQFFYEKVPRHFWRIAIVTRVLPSRDSEIRGAIVRIAKANTILKHPVNKLFAVQNTYHDTNQTDKTRHKEIASPSLALLQIVNIRERKPRQKKKANSTLQHLRTDFQSMMKSALMLCQLYIFIDIYSLIMTN